MIYNSSSASIASPNPNNTHQPYPNMHSQMADQQQKSQKNLQHVPLMRPSGIHRPPQFQNESDEDVQQVHSKLRRGPWSPEEDNKLLELVQFFGGEKNLNWVKISEELQTRTAKQARERFHQNLKPSLNRTPITPEEGRYIEELVEKYGKRWAEIARHLNGRSDNAIKNWWNGGANRRKRASTQGLTVNVNGSSSSGDEEEKAEYDNDSKSKQQLQSQLQRSKDSNEHPLTPGLQSISSNPPNTVHHGYYSQHQLPQVSAISTTASTSSPLSSLQFSSSNRSTTNSFSGLPPPPIQPLGNSESITLPPINSVLQQQQQQQVSQIQSEQPNQPNQPQFNVSIFGENETARPTPPQLSSGAHPSHQHQPVIPPNHHLYLQSGQSHSPAFQSIRSGRSASVDIRSNLEYLPSLRKRKLIDEFPSNSAGGNQPLRRHSAASITSSPLVPSIGNNGSQNSTSSISSNLYNNSNGSNHSTIPTSTGFQFNFTSASGTSSPYPGSPLSRLSSRNSSIVSADCTPLTHLSSDVNSRRSSIFAAYDQHNGNISNNSNSANSTMSGQFKSPSLAPRLSVSSGACSPQFFQSTSNISSITATNQSSNASQQPTMNPLNQVKKQFIPLSSTQTTLPPLSSVPLQSSLSNTSTASVSTTTSVNNNNSNAGLFNKEFNFGNKLPSITTPTTATTTPTTVAILQKPANGAGTATTGTSSSSSSLSLPPENNNKYNGATNDHQMDDGRGEDGSKTKKMSISFLV